MMAESDIDSWYDWKQGDRILELPRTNDLESTSNFSSFDSNYFNHSTTDVIGRKCSRINGFVGSEKPGSSVSSTEVRFINPAIYAESLEKEDEEHEVRIRVKVDCQNEIVSGRCNGEIAEANCGDSSGISDMLSSLSLKNDLANVGHAGDQTSAQETYRCYSLTSPVTTLSLENTVLRSNSVVSSRPGKRVERRCKIGDKAVGNDLYSARQTEPEVHRYTVNGQRVVQISASFSCTTMSEHSLNGVDFARKIAHEEWVRKKQEAALQKKQEEELAERKKQDEAEEIEREKEERERREKENFTKWMVRKKKEQDEKKAVVEKQLELQNRLKEIEEETAIAKALSLRQWSRKKKQEEQARQRKIELKQKRIDEERKKRLEESRKAYEKWRKTSRNKPKPATQGLLPHQKAKPAYVNPTPWQPIIEEAPDNSTDDTTSNKKTKMNQTKTSSKKNLTAH